MPASGKIRAKSPSTNEKMSSSVTNEASTSTDAISQGDWCHVVVTVGVNGGTDIVRLYIDGATEQVHVRRILSARRARQIHHERTTLPFNQAGQHLNNR